SKADQAAQDAQANISSLQRQIRAVTGDAKGGSKQASVEDLRAAIPPTAALSDFLREVNGIRDAVGVPDAFQSIVPSPPTLVGGVATINVGINVTGTYEQMHDYIDRLTKLPRL